MTDLSDYEASVMAQRPTKALVRDLLQRRRSDATTMQRLADTVEATNAQLEKVKADNGDLEATALAGCVRAIEAMHAAQRAGRNNEFGYATLQSSYHQRPDYTAEALGSDVGRILLHLAARYGIPIEPRQPEPIAPPEPRQLIEVPARIAQQLEHMVAQGWTP